MKIKNLFLTLQAILILIFNTSSLEALDVTAELHLAEDLPEKYQGKVLIGKYYTSINFKDWPADHDVDIFEERLINENKKVKKGSMSPSPKNGITFVAGAIGYLPGEPVTYTFNTHKKITEQIQIVPYPIFDVSKTDEAKIYVIMHSSNIYSIELSGFSKGEKLVFESKSYDENIVTEISFECDMPISYMPAVKEKEGGVSKVKITRESGEILKVEIPWGIESLKYALSL